MSYSFMQDEVYQIVAKQLNNIFNFDEKTEAGLLQNGIKDALVKLEYNCKKQKSKYLQDGKFNIYNSCQYTIFLYYLANTIHNSYKSKNIPGGVLDKLYYLNKVMNGVDLFYAIDLPDIWAVEHPVGAVMGRAQYSDHFFFYQHTTVGGNNGCYPNIGERVVLFANATILGNSNIGRNCLISANAYVKDQDVPPNTIVYGQSPNLIFKAKKDLIDTMFDKLFFC